MATIQVVKYPLSQTFNVTEDKTNTFHVERYAGNDFVLVFQVNDTAGDAVDISSFTTRNFGVYPMSSGTASFTKTPAFVTDGTDGQISVTVADGDTSSLAGTYRVELQISKTGTKVSLVRGTITIVETQIS